LLSDSVAAASSVSPHGRHVSIFYASKLNSVIDDGDLKWHRIRAKSFALFLIMFEVLVYSRKWHQKVAVRHMHHEVAKKMT
jgi:hypothetical protein